MSNTNDQAPLNMAHQHAASVVDEAVPGTGLNPDPTATELELAAAFKPIDEAVNEDDAPELVADAVIAQAGASLIVNLSLASRDYMANTVDYTAVDAPNGSKVNVFHPFYFNKAQDPAKGDGIARAVIVKAFELVDAFNSASLTLLGTDEQIRANLQVVLEKMVAEVEQALPWPSHHPVCQVGMSSPEESEEDLTPAISITLLMKELIRVTGWLVPNQADSNAFQPYRMVINVTIEGGEFYDSEDPHKYVRYAQSFISRLKKKATSETPVIQTVMLVPEELMYSDVQQLLSILCSNVDDYGYETAGRSQLHEDYNIHSAWLPESRMVDSQLLTKNGDILLIKSL